MELCRLCLSKEQKKLITVTKSNELTLKIHSCVSLEITNADSLPKTVCTLCLKKVNDWHDFKQMCIQSEEKLKLQSNKIMNQEQSGSKEYREWKCDYEENDGSDSDDETNCYFSEDCFIKNEVECSDYVYKCEVCSKEFDMCFDFIDHQDEHNGQPVFHCDKCYKVFTSRSDLVEHENNHLVACPKCEKMILKRSLKLHLIQHTDRYVCDECSHKFSSNSTLQQHIISVHTAIKNHICEVCGKRFASKTAMKTHFSIHAAKRAYNCKLCNYAGRTSSAVYIHMATHANETHSCEMCPKTFKSSRNLSDHLRRVHSKEKKHKCSYCDKKFVDRYMLMVHLRTHTGVRPFSCTLCDKAFIRSDSLKEHMATHGSRTLFECNQCMKKFTSKRGYGRHNCNVLAT